MQELCSGEQYGPWASCLNYCTILVVNISDSTKIDHCYSKPRKYTIKVIFSFTWAVFFYVKVSHFSSGHFPFRITIINYTLIMKIMMIKISFNKKLATFCRNIAIIKLLN